MESARFGQTIEAGARPDDATAGEPGAVDGAAPIEPKKEQMGGWAARRAAWATTTTPVDKAVPGSDPVSSEQQLPVLTDQVVAETVMILFFNQHEPPSLVDAPRRHQDVVGP